jgi:hypothetical protein
MIRRLSRRCSLALSAALLLLGRHADARQLAFDKAKAEAGFQVAGLVQGEGPAFAFGPRLTFNLDRRTAIDLSADLRTTSGPAPTSVRVFFVDVRRTLAETPNGAFFATMGVGGGKRRDTEPPYPTIYPGRRTDISYEHTVGTFNLGIGAQRAAGAHLTLTGELQLTMSSQYSVLRAAFGATLPLSPVKRRPDSRAARPAEFAGVPAGVTAWVTMADGVEWIGEVLNVTTTSIQLRRIDGTVALPLADVRLIKAPDSVKNGAKRGAIIGALVAIPAAFAGHEVCDGGTGCAIGFGLFAGGLSAGLGAVVGVMIDSFMEGQRVVYDASKPKGRPTLAPIVAPHALGLGGTVQW